MAKVLLVEDDNNLREIYEARLQAEGYDTATASDGEQALVVAKEAKPDLVISDVMMPKISGFEMLDILRNTDGLKDVKVIMLTALGQSEDKARADQLGADKYLVKSQVTLEDIVKTAHQLLDDGPAPAVPAAEPAAAAPAASTPAPAATDDAPASTADETQAMQAQIADFAAQPAAAAGSQTADDAAAAAHDDQVMASAVNELSGAADAQKPSDVAAVEVAPPASAEPAAAAESDDSSEDDVTATHKKVIKPISDGVDAKPDINELLAKEEAAKIIESGPADPEPTIPLAPEPPADPTLQVPPELQAAMTDQQPATPAPAETPAAVPSTPLDITEPPADPDQPNPNEVAL
jgi:CheY-like chemotaxis protein